MHSRSCARRRRIIRQDTVYQHRSESCRVALWRADGHGKGRRGSGEWWSHCKDPSHTRRPLGNIGERPNGQFVDTIPQYDTDSPQVHQSRMVGQLMSTSWSCIGNAFPYLAASGHSLYAKSASIYLSSMANLPNDHRVLRQHFVEGLHVARRSDRAWAGYDLIWW